MCDVDEVRSGGRLAGGLQFSLERRFRGRRRRGSLRSEASLRRSAVQRTRVEAAPSAGAQESLVLRLRCRAGAGRRLCFARL